MTPAPRAIFWSSAEAVSGAGLAAVSAFVVARIVGPAELGVGASAVALHVLLWVVVNALFADAIVQQAEMSRADLSSAFWASVCVGVLGAGVEACASFPLAASLGDGRLVAMSLLLAATLPLVGAGGAVQGLLTRRRDYRALALRTLAGQGAGTLAGVAAALLGAGAWAIVVQQLVTSVAGALSLLVRAGFRPQAILRAAPVRALLRIGLPLTASTLVNHGRYRLFALLIGATAGPAVLGQVHVAFRLVDALRELASTALWRLMLPAMSERQHDLASLQATSDRFLGGYATVVFPCCGAVLAAAAPTVAALLGPVWAPAGQAALPLALTAAYHFIWMAANVATIARGRPAAFLPMHVAATGLTLLGVAVLRPSSPADAGWIWFAAQLLASPLAIRAASHALRSGPLRLIQAGLPALGLTALAAAAAWAASEALGVDGRSSVAAARLAVGAAVYLPCAWLLLWRPPASVRAA